MRHIVSSLVLSVAPVFMLGACAVPPSASASTVEPPGVSTVAECRDVDATVVLDGTTQHLPARACREGSGAWALIHDDADVDTDAGANVNVNAGYPPPDAYFAYDPWFWGYPFGFSSVVVFGSGRFHGHDRYGFRGFGNHGFGNHGFGNNGFHGGGMRHR
jgi:hypothetical protein